MKSSSNFGALMGLILASAFAESLKSSPKANKDAAPETRANNSLNDLLDSIEKQLGEFTGTDCVGDCAGCDSADKPKQTKSYHIGLHIRGEVSEEIAALVGGLPNDPDTQDEAACDRILTALLIGRAKSMKPLTDEEEHIQDAAIQYFADGIGYLNKLHASLGPITQDAQSAA